MKPFETLARTTTPEGRELTFHRRDGVYWINLDGDELMSSRAPGSERALAELSCGDLGAGARVLIGGLGLGYTLRAALDVLPRQAEVVVAEIFASVIDFNHAHRKDLQEAALRDPRTRIVEGDVCEVIFERGPWDAILLDVDNGPEASSLDSNQRLYDPPGLRRILKTLRPKGVLAVWSAHPEPRFVKTLQRCGYEARSQVVRSRGGKGARHTLFLGRRPS